VLVSRKIPWTTVDETAFKEVKRVKVAATYVDPRPLKTTSENVTDITQMTMFGMGERGQRYVVDGCSWSPPPVVSGEVTAVVVPVVVIAVCGAIAVCVIVDLVMHIPELGE
jgi:hypothetical protein